MAPSLNVMGIVAISDPPLFEHMMAQEGLRIVGVQSDDPLEMSVQEEAVTAIASTLTEDIHEPIELTRRQHSLKRLAENVGYVVALEEGLDQMPGSDCNPVKAKLRHPEEPTTPAAPPGGEQGQPEGAAPPQQ